MGSCRQIMKRSYAIAAAARDAIGRETKKGKMKERFPRTCGAEHQDMFSHYWSMRSADDV
jgi:hypothetical protein